MQQVSGSWFGDIDQGLGTSSLLIQIIRIRPCCQSQLTVQPIGDLSGPDLQISNPDPSSLDSSAMVLAVSTAGQYWATCCGVVSIDGRNAS